eukprot:GHVO01069383.1.p1 GENE.GHVO01069383.1~~GHVO01069383.1.p1  ORF type:complete len:364 (+),score=38.35 GHVO01069383.1:37-1128(+)
MKSEREFSVPPPSGLLGLGIGCTANNVLPLSVNDSIAEIEVITHHFKHGQALVVFNSPENRTKSLITWARSASTGSKTPSADRHSRSATSLTAQQSAQSALTMKADTSGCPAKKSKYSSSTNADTTPKSGTAETQEDMDAAREQFEANPGWANFAGAFGEDYFTFGYFGRYLGPGKPQASFTLKETLCVITLEENGVCTLQSYSPDGSKLDSVKYEVKHVGALLARKMFEANDGWDTLSKPFSESLDYTCDEGGRPQVIFKLGDKECVISLKGNVFNFRGAGSELKDIKGSASPGSASPGSASPGSASAGSEKAGSASPGSASAGSELEEVKKMKTLLAREQFEANDGWDTLSKVCVWVGLIS